MPFRVRRADALGGGHPVGPLQFTGIIGVVFLRGREYRLATYLGARITRLGDGAVEVRQGKYTLTARLIEKTTHPLYAPSGGAMNRIIRGKRGLLRRLPVLSGQHGAA